MLCLVSLVLSLRLPGFPNIRPRAARLLKSCTQSLQVETTVSRTQSFLRWVRLQLLPLKPLLEALQIFPKDKLIEGIGGVTSSFGFFWRGQRTKPPFQTKKRSTKEQTHLEVTRTTVLSNDLKQTDPLSFFPTENGAPSSSSCNPPSLH